MLGADWHLVRRLTTSVTSPTSGIGGASSREMQL